MQKSVVFLTRLYYPHIGGVERHVYGLTQELIKKNIKVTIITEQYDPLLKLFERTKSLTILRIPYPVLGDKIRTWQWLKTKESLLLNADIIHVHDIFWWLYPFKIKYFKKPIYTTFHGYENDPPTSKEIWQRRTIAHLSKKVVAVGTYIEKWYGTRANLITFGAADYKPSALPSSHTAVFIGRLARDTEIIRYLDMFAFLNKIVSLDIYGEGPLLEQVLLKIKSAKLPAAVHGPVTNPAKVLKNARYVFTTQYLGILEAMQTKRLVVALYSSPLKGDYLACHPQKDTMLIDSAVEALAKQLLQLTTIQEKLRIDLAQTWAKNQTFSQLTEKYIQLWQ